MTRQYFSTKDIIDAAGFGAAERRKIRSLESRLSNLRRGEIQKRKRNSKYDDSYRDNLTILSPKLKFGIDWIELINGRVAYTQRGRFKAIREIRPKQDD